MLLDHHLLYVGVISPKEERIDTSSNLSHEMPRVVRSNTCKNIVTSFYPKNISFKKMIK